jgi:hypothetical protein
LRPRQPVASLSLFDQNEISTTTLDLHPKINSDTPTSCPICCEVTTRSTKVGYLIYLGNSNGVLLVLILSYCEDGSMLLA